MNLLGQYTWCTDTQDCDASDGIITAKNLILQDTVNHGIIFKNINADVWNIRSDVIDDSLNIVNGVGDIVGRFNQNGFFGIGKFPDDIYYLPRDRIGVSDGDAIVYDVSSNTCSFSRRDITLHVKIDTTSIIFPNGIIETPLMVYGQLNGSLLKPGSIISSSLTGAFNVPAIGPWTLTLRKKMFDTILSYPITFPNSAVIAQQFKMTIDTTFRTVGPTASAYCVCSFEYNDDSGQYVKNIFEIGFPTINTTINLYDLQITGQFNGSPIGLSINCRGGFFKLY